MTKSLEVDRGPGGEVKKSINKNEKKLKRKTHVHSVVDFHHMQMLFPSRLKSLHLL